MAGSSVVWGKFSDRNWYEKKRLKLFDVEFCLKNRYGIFEVFRICRLFFNFFFLSGNGDLNLALAV